MSTTDLQDLPPLSTLSNLISTTTDNLTLISLYEELLIIQSTTTTFPHSNSLDRNTISSKLIEYYNIQSLMDINNSRYDSAYEFLKKAMIVLNNKKDVLLRAVTYNNFSIYYKNINKYRISLLFINKALEIEENYSKNNVYYKIADTYLNKCVILSLLYKYNESLHACKLAMKYILLELNIITENNLLFNIEVLNNIISLDRLHVLAIAYLNYSIQLDYLNKNSCLLYYELAYSIIKIANTEGMIESFENALNKARKKWSNNEKYIK